MERRWCPVEFDISYVVRRERYNLANKYSRKRKYNAAQGLDTIHDVRNGKLKKRKA